MKPYGPSKIPKNRQITLPAELLKQVDIEIGDEVFVCKAEDIEGALTVVPVEVIVSWIDSGRRQDAPSSPAEDTDSVQLEP